MRCFIPGEAELPDYPAVILSVDYPSSQTDRKPAAKDRFGFYHKVKKIVA
jgi:hypothetical protein